jgi:CBS domain-containing protein
VDGGVNGEVSFILRNMGVSSSVSGSYLFNAPSVGHALMNLTKREIESHFKVGDFMIPIEECPIVHLEEINLRQVLETIENGNLGFCLVGNKDGMLSGIISSADIRKALLKSMDQHSELNPKTMINENPVHLFEDNTVVEMLQLIKKCNFPVMYMPVVDREGKACGILNFVHLIKGEL